MATDLWCFVVSYYTVALKSFEDILCGMSLWQLCEWPPTRIAFP